LGLGGGMDGDEEKRGLVLPLIVGTIVSVFWSGYFLIKDQNTLHLLGAQNYAAVAGEVLGGDLVTVGIVWAIVYFAFVRRAGLVLFLVLFGATVAVDGTGLYLLDMTGREAVARDNAQMAIAMQEIRRAVAALGDPNKPPIDLTVKSTGYAGVLEGAAKRELAAQRKAADDYHAAIAATDYPGILTPGRLGARGGLAAAHRKLTEAVAAIRGYRNAMQAAEDDYRASLTAAAMPDAVRTEALNGFDLSLVRERPRIERVLEADDALFVEAFTLVDDLAHAKGRWFGQGKAIEFAEPADARAYNAHVLRLRRLTAEQNAAVAASRTTAPR
jgi:hypothetical protein